MRRTYTRRRKKKIQRGGMAGLHIGTPQPIQRLSGPVSVYVLRPSTPFLATIVLFGDVHRDYSHRCPNPCTVAEGCAPIEDPLFLQTLDHLVATEYPIDFYVETSSTFEEEQKGSSVLFQAFLHQTVRPCFDRQRVHENGTCPAPHIRWHFGDVRFFPNTVEFDLHHTLYGYTSYLYQRVKLGKQMMKRLTTYLSNPSLHVFHAFLSFPSLPSSDRFLSLDRKLQQAVIRYSKSIPSDSSVEEYIDGVLSQMVPQHANSDARTRLEHYVHATNEYIEHLVHIIAEQLLVPRSVIAKQVVKQPFSSWTELSFWMEQMKEQLTQNMRLHAYAFRMVFLATHSDSDGNGMMKMFEQAITSEQQWFSIDLHALHVSDLFMLTQIAIRVTSILASLYTLLRMLKTPAGGKRARLQFAYFGNQHIHHLIDMLIHPEIGYTVKYAHPVTTMPDGKPSRCISIQEPIDLEDDARTLAKQRDPVIIQPDRSQLEEEQRARNKNRTHRLKRRTKNTHFEKGYQPNSNRNSNNRNRNLNSNSNRNLNSNSENRNKEKRARTGTSKNLKK